jgi:hypothetical protein
LLAASCTRAVLALPSSACCTISLAVSCERLMSSCSLRAWAIQPSTSEAASREILRTSFYGQVLASLELKHKVPRTLVSSFALPTISISFGSALDGTDAEATSSSCGNAPCSTDCRMASPSFSSGICEDMNTTAHLSF